MILDAWGWRTGTTQREGMGREEGGGFKVRNTGIPLAEAENVKGRGRVQDGEHMYTCGRFISIFGKTNTIL